ncbi:MAG: hypothetical protein A2W00_09095 [Candidatus Eisenbacteria bacterium RBG_16_71_46]|nr:MAG: hypothetical protein A2W00_09095 [Candidatus Eisenbacteria bacterium RBG_16_71_46]OGF24676.1 MAG: hypothetical protein A2V63_07680 [Candidatus Eisenbacteria bacterium RBG_19FT_COMBO_70_11]
MAKRFFYVCAGFLCLALAYHLGATSATAQAGAKGQIRHVQAAGDYLWVVTDNDEIYSLNRDQAASVAHGEGWAKFKLGAFH